MKALVKYYKSLSPLSPRAELVQTLMEKTGRDRSTISRWLNGSSSPQTKLERECVEQITGIKL
jgi:hypothetical protein